MSKRVLFGEGDEFLKREGLTLEPEIWEDGLRTDTGPGNFEWWYFDAHFDDGSTVVIVYHTKPLLLRTGPLKPMIAITITRPDGQKLSSFPIYRPGQFEAEKDQCDIRIGPSRVHGDLHRYELHAEGSNLSADLVFTGQVPPWRPGSGFNYYNEELTRFFAWLPSIPFGHVEGTLTYDGQTRPVRGTGYHDHNWGNIGLNEVLSHWYWGRAHLGDYTLIFANVVAADSYNNQVFPVFLLAKGSRVLTDDGRFLTLQKGEEQTHISRKTFPGRLDFYWQRDIETIHLAIRKPRIIESTSMLTGLPGWKRSLARLFTNPYYFRFEADLELSVSISGECSIEHGPVIYELMILH
ncbi:MAG: hypothetical protein FD147_568 [Chloroflexi bacterium]|nr:MAG: hypothetical protein FD147_568 [Chloroflexota bacterium]